MRRPENLGWNQFPGFSLISDFCKACYPLRSALTSPQPNWEWLLWRPGGKEGRFITTKSYLHTSLHKCFEDSSYKLNFTQLGKSFERPMWGNPMLLSCQDPVWKPQSSLFHSQAAFMQAMEHHGFAKGRWQNKEGGQTLAQLSLSW